MKRIVLALVLLLIPSIAAATCTANFSPSTACGTVNGGAPGPVPFSTITSGILPQVTVGLSLPIAVFNLTTPTVITSGTLTAKFQTQTTSTFFAGPTSGAAAFPTFRNIVSSDLPLATSSAPGAVQPDNVTTSVTSGVISALGTTSVIPSTSVTSSFTIGSVNRGTAYNNCNANGTIVATLPVAVPGLYYEGFVCSTWNFEFLASGIDTIYVGSTQTVSGNIISNIPGAKIRLYSEFAGIWSTLATGPWTVN